MCAAIKVDIISDVVCPWCVIGFRRLEKAIADRGMEEAVQFEWHPFELNPDMQPEGENLLDHMTRKYGSTPEQSHCFRAELAERGAELGFIFNFFDGMKMVNTRDAHILIDYAKGQGRQTELQRRLFAAYFEEQKDISDREVLKGELQQAGLDVDEALRVLQDDEIRQRIRGREKFWVERGISGVPTMIFNQAVVLNGAQPASVYGDILDDFRGQF
ncbi:DsbA family oxidoreductase [Pontiella agarivorans]|uniref:DsbA family oxidoreductase n=1 Tax=Pontiella agarivorans TaxID=3038953 RepID=A0ABU5MZ56_9BACT|nr:DsbA family oxidoreductase [Pontiella agarivorans]MDZ8119487.1 DsbA family oxidoreductase [Pontiella agarivorans]